MAYKGNLAIGSETETQEERRLKQRSYLGGAGLYRKASTAGFGCHRFTHRNSKQAEHLRMNECGRRCSGTIGISCWAQYSTLIYITTLLASGCHAQLLAIFDEYLTSPIKFVEALRIGDMASCVFPKCVLGLYGNVVFAQLAYLRARFRCYSAGGPKPGSRQELCTRSA